MQIIISDNKINDIRISDNNINDKDKNGQKYQVKCIKVI